LLAIGRAKACQSTQSKIAVSAKNSRNIELELDRNLPRSAILLPLSAHEASP
jgi:hypothetical protein